MVAALPTRPVTGVRSAPMFAAACSSSDRSPANNSAGVLVQAYVGEQGEGWFVSHRPDPNADPVRIQCKVGKAQARTMLRQLARDYAKKLGVKARIER